jgi:Kef-type K+ transport system membrane component KefB
MHGTDSCLLPPSAPCRVFELVAEARSEETFIALVLLTVTGASLLTQRLGFSDTLGAFVAGVLLSGEC